MIDEDLADYYKKMIKDGLIAENGQPLKCECGCTEFEAVNCYGGEYGLEEYDEKCTGCNKVVGSFHYGSWSV